MGEVKRRLADGGWAKGGGKAKMEERRGGAQCGEGRKLGRKQVGEER